MRNLHLTFDCSTHSQKVEISQNFVAFSEYMNFTKLYCSYMSMSYLLNNLGSIWYHSEPSDVPYSLNQFLGWDFFTPSHSKTAIVKCLIMR